MRGSSRIIGGKDVMNGEFPWQVALLDGTTPSDQYCGGTLVSDRHVVTAAHCVVEVDGDFKPRVLIGDTNLAIDNDIAVLTLSRPLNLYAYPNIKPACLPKTETVE